MSENNPTPYIKWGNYKSTDPNNPDILKFHAVDTSVVSSELTVNVRAIQELDDGEENEVYIPLASHESTNKQLLKEWEERIRKKKIKVGTKFQIHTYLGISKNKRTIRRYKLVI